MLCRNTQFVQDYTLFDITQRVSNLYTVSSSIWKKLHQAEKIYTGTACGACDKYEVCNSFIQVIL